MYHDLTVYHQGSSDEHHDSRAQIKKACAATRGPSVTIPMPRYAEMCVRDHGLLRGWFARCRAEHPVTDGVKDFGFTGYKFGRAWFQIDRDPTPYSIEVDTAEAARVLHLDGEIA